MKVEELSGAQPAEVMNLGSWTRSSNWDIILDPLNGKGFIKVSEVDEKGILPFVESLSQCPKHGLHNPFKAPERYLMFGDVTAKAVNKLSLPEVSNFFTKLIQRVASKIYQQALGEVVVTHKFLENVCSDQVEDATKALGATNGTTLEKNGQILRVAYAKSIMGTSSCLCWCCN